VEFARTADDLFLVRTRRPATSRVRGLSPCLTRDFILVSRSFPLLRTGLSPRRSCEYAGAASKATTKASTAILTNRPKMEAL
jgi:hypothetical protein